MPPADNTEFYLAEYFFVRIQVACSKLTQAEQFYKVLARLSEKQPHLSASAPQFQQESTRRRCAGAHRCQKEPVLKFIEDFTAYAGSRSTRYTRCLLKDRRINSVASKSFGPPLPRAMGI